MTCPRRSTAVHRRRRLLLDRALLDGWMARPHDAGIEDPATRAALAAVIHELAHFYDRTPQGRLSRDPRLLDLAGWQVSPMRLGLRSSHNAFSRSQPGPLRAGEPGRVRRSESRIFPAGSGLRLPPAGPVPLFRRAFRQRAAAGRMRARLRVPAGRRRCRPLAAAAARPRPRLRGRVPARRRQRAADEPLGPQHAAAGDLRAGPRARARLPVRPAVPPGAVVPRVRG